MKEKVECEKDNNVDKEDCDPGTAIKKDCKWIWRSVGDDVERLEKVCTHQRDCFKIMKTEKCQIVKRYARLSFSSEEY